MSKRKAPGQEPAQGAAATPAGDDSKRLLHRTTLRELVKHHLGVDSVSPGVEELLLDVGDDFLEHVAAGAAALARHRGGDSLEAEDVRLHCERVWGLPLPGHGAGTVLPGRIDGEASGCATACCVTSRASHLLFLTRLVCTQGAHREACGDKAHGAERKPSTWGAAKGSRRGRARARESRIAWCVCVCVYVRHSQKNTARTSSAPNPLPQAGHLRCRVSRLIRMQSAQNMWPHLVMLCCFWRELHTWQLSIIL